MVHLCLIFECKTFCTTDIFLIYLTDESSFKIKSFFLLILYGGQKEEIRIVTQNEGRTPNGERNTQSRIS